MKVYTISAWSSMSSLIEQINAAMRHGAVIVIKNFYQTEPEFASFLDYFGTPSTQVPGHTSTVLHMGEEGKDGWYNTLKTIRPHFDGIQQIAKRKVLPMGFLYANQIDPELIGGRTYFLDLETLWIRAMKDPLLSKVEWENLFGLYANNPAEKPTLERVWRQSPYTGNEYLLIDDWFTRSLQDRDEKTLHGAFLNRYLDLIRTAHRYEHVWNCGDMLIWSNENVLHGRTTLDSGVRKLWRGVVWTG